MLKQIFGYLLLITLLYSCASQVAPTGGPKDETPPVVIRSNPENLSIHFDASKIDLRFDEFIQLGDFTSQVFFSPALEGKPQYRVHGKTLTITLNSSLQPKTTYTISFGDAVKDINEGNIMVNYQYVFSTGDYIDSMRVQGIVKGAADAQPKENIQVMLYRDLSDSIVAKARPTYNARTDKSGSFKIDHLKEGTYKLFALNDQNFNLLYDLPGEEVAFADSGIEINDTAAFYNLILFKPSGEKQKILNAGSYQPGRVTFSMAKRIEQFSVTPLSGNAKDGVLQFNATKDTVLFWLNDFTSDSIAFTLSDIDFADTVKVRMKKIDEKDKIFAPKLLIISPFKKGKTNSQQEPDKPIRLEFSNPVISVNEKKIQQLVNDTLKKAENIQAVLEKDTVTQKRRASFSTPLAEKTRYTLIIPDSSFLDVFGNYNDSVALPFTTFEKTETGNLIMRITTDSSKNYFYELRAADGSLIAAAGLKRAFEEVRFNSLRPGKYSLKVVEDLNGNKRWDSGDYWKHLQPEKIYNYTEEITLRANWDLELEMKVGVSKKPLSLKTVK